MGSALHSRPLFPERAAPSGALRNRILFLSLLWLLVLMPFLFWRGTWFGRPLSDQQLETYLHDNNPSHAQHALLQLGNRMAHKDPTVEVWYPELVELAAAPDEVVRAASARVMGEDSSSSVFHDQLRQMLDDDSSAVRQEAALSLARFGDGAGHDLILALLQPWKAGAPRPGRVVELAMGGMNITPDGVLVKLDCGGSLVDIHPPHAGRVGSALVHPGEQVAAGAELVTLEPSADFAWRGLRALTSIGRSEDLPTVDAYLNFSPLVHERIRQQAVLTDKTIRDRNSVATSQQEAAAPNK